MLRRFKDLLRRAFLADDAVRLKLGDAFLDYVQDGDKITVKADGTVIVER